MIRIEHPLCQIYGIDGGLHHISDVERKGLRVDANPAPAAACNDAVHIDAVAISVTAHGNVIRMDLNALAYGRGP